MFNKDEEEFRVYIKYEDGEYQLQTAVDLHGCNWRDEINLLDELRKYLQDKEQE